MHDLPIEMKKAALLTALIGKWRPTAEPAAFDYYCVMPGPGWYSNPVLHEKAAARDPTTKGSSMAMTWSIQNE